MIAAALSTRITPISLTSESIKAFGRRTVTPVPDASSGYRLGSSQSSGVGFPATRGMPAAAIESEYSPWPAVSWSLIVATTPSSSIVEAHAIAWSRVPPSSQLVTSMHEPLAPPRALNPSAAAVKASAWSPSEIDDVSKVVVRPTRSGSAASSQGPSSQRPIACVVDLLGGFAAVAAVVTATALVIVATAGGGDERQGHEHPDHPDKRPRHSATPPLGRRSRPDRRRGAG